MSATRMLYTWQFWVNVTGLDVVGWLMKASRYGVHSPRAGDQAGAVIADVLIVAAVLGIRAARSWHARRFVRRDRAS